jgi:hypothetical protein
MPALHGAVSRFPRVLVKALQSLGMWSAAASGRGRRTMPGDFSQGDFSNGCWPNFNCLPQLSAVIVIQTTGE